jgi:hypothetical protein
MREEVGESRFKQFALKVSKMSVYRPHPAGGLKLLSEGCFYYLNSIIVFE